MNPTPNSIDPELLMKPGEESYFNTLLWNIGAGNATSRSTMQAIISDLLILDFRVTDVGHGWVAVWVNGDALNELRTKQTSEANKKSLRGFFKLMPKLTLVAVLGSALLSAIAAWKITVTNLFYTNLGAVGFGVAFVRMFGLCMGVYVICVVIFILNKGRVP